MLPYFEILRRWCEKSYSTWCRKSCLEKEYYFESRVVDCYIKIVKWRVVEIERIIRREMRLYTIGKISFSVDCISINIFIDCIYILKKQVVTALYSFLFNKHAIFITFSQKLFLFIESICIQIIIIFTFFAWMIFMLLI